MMNAKRRRSDEPAADEERSNRRHAETARDCYQEVLGGRDGELEEDSTVRSSWFCHLEWIQRGGHSSDTPLHTTADTSIAPPGDVTDEIKSLQSRLCQVKRRLWPAAEKCTEAFNSCHQDSSTTGYREFVEARRACNAYEVLGEGQSGGLNNLFMNRSAIKLANVDAVLDFCLTRFSGQGPFLFVDLCGAPGGFSEYIMRRCYTAQVNVCRGYGMSLTGTNEHGQGTPWKLQDAVHVENGMHCTYRVCQGADGTGDIFHWDNVKELQNLLVHDVQIKQEPDGSQHNESEKVHLILADGGFDAQRDSEHQEELAQKLVVCEVAAGLSLLRQGGTLVIKMFGFQTAVVRTVMTDLFFLFESLVVLKPISSRPASAERYVVCHGFQGLPAGWDGPRWRNRMFLGQSMATGSMAVGSEEDAIRPFNRYLDTFDRDMLNLNLKACFSIMSYLESKYRATTASAGGEPDTIDPYFGREQSLVNIESYKFAWGLT